MIYCGSNSKLAVSRKYLHEFDIAQIPKFRGHVKDVDFLESIEKSITQI